MLTNTVVCDFYNFISRAVNCKKTAKCYRTELFFINGRKPQNTNSHTFASPGLSSVSATCHPRLNACNRAIHIHLQYNLGYERNLISEIPFEFHSQFTFALPNLQAPIPDSIPHCLTDPGSYDKFQRALQKLSDSSIVQI